MKETIQSLEKLSSQLENIIKKDEPEKDDLQLPNTLDIYFYYMPDLKVGDVNFPEGLGIENLPFGRAYILTNEALFFTEHAQLMYTEEDGYEQFWEHVEKVNTSQSRRDAIKANYFRISNRCPLSAQDISWLKSSTKEEQLVQFKEKFIVFLNENLNVVKLQKDRVIPIDGTKPYTGLFNNSSKSSHNIDNDTLNQITKYDSMMETILQQIHYHFSSLHTDITNHISKLSSAPVSFPIK